MSPRLLLAALLALAVPAFAATPAQDAKPAPKAEAKKGPSLAVGDAAPALSIEKWVKGAPVAQFEKGKVYVVEFWATWCGPCIASMPHITELQKKHRDQGLTVIGVTSADRNNTLEKVEKMVAEKGDGMGYTVAWDKERTTNEAYMKAAEQRGIPCSFLVDRDGKIAYIGHPMNLDATLELVIAGKHDIAKLKADAAKAKEAEMKAEELQGKLFEAVKAADWDAVDKACDELGALGGEFAEGAAVTKFQIFLMEAKNMERAYDAARKALEGPCKDSMRALNFMAWLIVDPDQNHEETDLDVALKIAERANVLGKDKDAGVLDTLARVHYMKGDLAKAIEIQKKAVALDAKLQKQLDEYEAAAKDKK